MAPRFALVGARAWRMMTWSSTEGPLEKRLGEQDDKIQALQKDMEKMAVNQRKFEDHTNKCFREAEDRDKQNVEQMQTAMRGLQKDLEHSLTKSMQANAQAMQEQLQDLKSLFTSHANKRKSEAAADMETWLAIHVTHTVLTFLTFLSFACLSVVGCLLSAFPNWQTSFLFLQCSGDIIFLRLSESFDGKTKKMENDIWPLQTSQPAFGMFLGEPGEILL